MGPPKVEVHSLRKVGEREVMKKDKSDTTGWDSSKKNDAIHSENCCAHFFCHSAFEEKNEEEKMTKCDMTGKWGPKKSHFASDVLLKDS